MTPLSQKTKFLTHSALYLALAVLLPIGFHAFGLGGRIFLPMHLPVLLAGFLLGPVGGLLIGIIAPSLSFLLTGMPPSYAVPLMSLELPLYGFVAGMFFYRMKLNIYLSLIVAMIFGRIMFGLGLLLLGLFIDLPYNVIFFFSAAGPIVTGLPGIALQIIVVPLIVAAVKRIKK